MSSAYFPPKLGSHAAPCGGCGGSSVFVVLDGGLCPGPDPEPSPGLPGCCARAEAPSSVAARKAANAVRMASLGGEGERPYELSANRLRQTAGALLGGGLHP